jgi:succinyl-CoA synthetase beta subunit
LDLFEYQGKELFARWGIPVPDGRVVTTPEGAREAAAELGGRVALKAQVAAGGRGKAGGVKVVATPDDAEQAAKLILGMDIGGNQVGQLLVEVASQIDAEYYAAVTLDRRAGTALFMVSSRGGIDVESAGEGSMAAVHVDPLLGLPDFQVRSLVFGAGLDPRARLDAARLLARLYRMFVEADASLVEINPLALTPAGLVALDAKVSLDDSALFRHPDFASFKGGTRRPDPQEALADEAGLNFVKLDGDIGIIGNGAGLVMSTLDVVAQAGGAPANFLDVGGGAGAETLAKALEVVVAGPSVGSVLVNIFGGITRGDLVAQGLLEALGRTTVKVPIVVRLEGTNAPEGREILARAHHPNVRVAEGMLEAAREAVEAAR